MISSVLKFISGTVIKTNQTNKTVHLSDGTKWNSSKFHEYVALLRAFMWREVQQSDEVKIIQQEIDKTKQDIILKLKSKEYFYSRIDNIIQYGKYRGKRVSKVAQTDTKYLDWYFKTVAQQDIINRF